MTSAKRVAGAGLLALRVLPAVAFIIAPFFLVQAPARLITRRCEEPQTKRAAIIGIGLWTAIVYATVVLGGVL